MAARKVRHDHAVVGVFLLIDSNEEFHDLLPISSTHSANSGERFLGRLREPREWGTFAAQSDLFPIFRGLLLPVVVVVKAHQSCLLCLACQSRTRCMAVAVTSP